MPDVVVRGIDNDMAERIKALARERQAPINDVIIELIRVGLNPRPTAPEPAVDNPRQDIAMLGGTWAQDEAAALRAAIEAFERIP